MKIYNTRAQAEKDLPIAQKQDSKDASIVPVFNGRHVFGIKVGANLWYMGEGQKPQESKQNEGTGAGVVSPAATGTKTF
jgi:hypothetical protein